MNCKSNKVYLTSIIVFCSVFISPDSIGQDNDAAYVCEKGDATRSVEVVVEPGYACRVKYSKFSKPTFPWSARNDAEYCQPKATGLVNKLVLSGWECDSGDELRSILQSQIESYGRYTKILNTIGKTCNFYPSEAQFGNLCGDDREEAAIVYTCEANNDNWSQHLAVFLEVESEPIIIEVGGSGYRQVANYYIDSDRIMMETEKVDLVESIDATQYPLEKASISCQISAESNWELIEQQH